MKNTSDKDIKWLEGVFKQIYDEDSSAPEPSQKWQKDVMREVRNIQFSNQSTWSVFFILRQLCWPAAQLVFALIIMIGIYLINDASLTNLDMSLFYTEMPLSSDNLISFYSF